MVNLRCVHNLLCHRHSTCLVYAEDVLQREARGVVICLTTWQNTKSHDILNCRFHRIRACFTTKETFLGLVHFEIRDYL